MQNPQLEIEILKTLLKTRDMQIEILKYRLEGMEQHEKYLLDQVNKFRGLLVEGKEMFGGQSVIVEPLKLD